MYIYIYLSSVLLLSYPRHVSKVQLSPHWPSYMGIALLMAFDNVKRSKFVL